MNEWGKYRRKGLYEMRPYISGEVLEGVSIIAADLAAGSPRIGDMIARNPKDHSDKWLVSEQFFKENMEPL